MKKEKKTDTIAKNDPALPPDYRTTDKGEEMERENEESLHNAYRNRKRVATEGTTQEQANKEGRQQDNTKDPGSSNK